MFYFYFVWICMIKWNRVFKWRFVFLCSVRKNIVSSFFSQKVTLCFVEQLFLTHSKILGEFISHNTANFYLEASSFLMDRNIGSSAFVWSSFNMASLLGCSWTGIWTFVGLCWVQIHYSANLKDSENVDRWLAVLSSSIVH